MSAQPQDLPAQNADDMSADYQQHRDQLERSAAFDEMMKAAGGSQTEQPQKPTEQPQKLGTWAMDPTMSMAFNKGKDIAKDVSQFAVGKYGGENQHGPELPRAIYSGAHDAFESMMHGIDKLSMWAGSKGPDFMKEGMKFNSDFPYVHAATAEELANPENRPMAGDLVGKVEGPKTVTGGIVKGISQFVTSTLTAGKVVGVASKFTGGSGTAAYLVNMAKNGFSAFAGFEGSQKRLSDLVQQYPQLQNPLTDFMSSKPDDNEAEGRLKNAVEGLGVGAVLDGFVHSLRVLRDAQNTKAQVETAAQAPEPQVPKVNQDAFAPLGDVNAPEGQPLVKVATENPYQKSTAFQKGQALAATGQMAPEDLKVMSNPAYPDELAGAASPGATEAVAKEPKVYFNFARINGPDDVKRMMSQLTDAIAEKNGPASGATRSWETVKMDAASEDAWKSLVSRGTTPLTDAQTVAAREMWVGSGNALRGVRDSYIDAPTPENLLAFRKQLTTHAMINEEVLGARAAAARSFGAWRIPVSGDDRGLAQLTQQVQAAGGLEANLAFAKQLRATDFAGMQSELDAAIQKGAYAKTRDAFLQAWQGGLLTNPLTHTKVFISNASQFAMNILERKTAAGISQLLGDENGVQGGEAAANYAALVDSVKDSFRFASKVANASRAFFVDESFQMPKDDSAASMAVNAAKTGQYSIGESWGETGQQYAGALSSEALGLSDTGWLGKTADLLGQMTRIPGRALMADHDWFRTTAYRAEVRALSLRQAAQEMNAGDITAEDVPRRIAELVENPPSSLNLSAIDAAKYRTWTDTPGKFAEWIKEGRQKIPELRLIAPFVDIPSRLMSSTMEGTPFAPLMSRFRQEVSAGGARQAMALAKMGVGSSIMMAAADATMSGQLTGAGPVDKGQREAMEREGWQPYSMKMANGRWFQYNRMETIGTAASLAADAAETITHFQKGVGVDDDPDVETLALAVPLALAQDVTSKTYLEGWANLFEGMSNPKTRGKALIENTVASLIPAGASAVARQIDPTVRDVRNMIDALKARTPGMSSSVGPRLDLWGQPVSRESGLGKAYDSFVPFSSRKGGDNPIDKEILRLGMNETMPSAKVSFNGANVDLSKEPKLYSRYVELAGNEIKSPLTGKGARDSLNDLVNGTHPLSALYNLKSDGVDGGKAEMIKQTIDQFRKDARQKLLEENPDLSQKVDALRDRKAQLRLPQ